MNPIRFLNRMIWAGLILVGLVFAIHAVASGHTWLSLLGGLPLLGMASAVSVEKFASSVKLEMFDHDPDATTATVCTGGGWVDLADYGGFSVAAMSSALTGNGITLLEIVASDAADGSTNVTVVKTSGTVAADAVGDYVYLECLAAELAQLSSAGSISPGLRYVAARITVHNAADEAVVTYVRFQPRYGYTGLTATTIA